MKKVILFALPHSQACRQRKFLRTLMANDEEVSAHGKLFRFSKSPAVSGSKPNGDDMEVRIPNDGGYLTKCHEILKPNFNTSWRNEGVIERTATKERVSAALERSRVVALIGPPQCGKTTLAEEFPSPDSESYPTRARPGGGC